MFITTSSGVTVDATLQHADVRDFALAISVVAIKLHALSEYYDMLKPEFQGACERVYANRLMQHGSL